MQSKGLTDDKDASEFAYFAFAYACVASENQALVACHRRTPCNAINKLIR